MALYKFLQQQYEAAVKNGDTKRASRISRQLLDAAFWANYNQALRGNWSVRLGE